MNIVAPVLNKNDKKICAGKKSGKKKSIHFISFQQKMIQFARKNSGFFGSKPHKASIPSSEFQEKVTIRFMQKVGNRLINVHCIFILGKQEKDQSLQL
jgi:hypothetical protein